MTISKCFGCRKIYTKIADSTADRQNVFGNWFGLKNITIFESTDFISKKIIQNIDESSCIRVFTTTLFIMGKNPRNNLIAQQ